MIWASNPTIRNICHEPHAPSDRGLCWAQVEFLSPEKLALLALIIGLVFGSRSLPRIARLAGRGIREGRETLGIDQIRGEVGAARSSLAEATNIGAGERDGPEGDVTEDGAEQGAATPQVRKSES